MATCQYCKEKTKRRSVISGYVQGRKKTFLVCQDCEEFIDYHNQNGEELPD